jgi:membrane associated rhomboid family serine protease
MFPLRDEIKSESTPWLTWLLIALNSAVFFYELSLGEALNNLVMNYGLVPWKMTRGISENGFSVQDNVVPWVTSMFLHGGWLHFLGNMWFLYIFGDNVEDRLGRGRYLALYLSGGLLAALTQVVASPASPVPMVGASGAIAAVMGAYLVLYPRARVFSVIPIFILLYFVRIPAFIFIGIWFGLQFLQGYASLLAGNESAGVAWWAHIGGLLGGVLLACILRSGTRPRGRRDFRRGSVNVVRGPWK